MDIYVTFFGRFRECVGQRSALYELDDGATVADLIARIEGQYPELVRLGMDLCILVNGELTSAVASLDDGDRVYVVGPTTATGMTLELVVATLGLDNYAWASEFARSHAAQRHYWANSTSSELDEGRLWLIADEIADLINGSTLPDIEKVRLLFLIYQEVPSDWLLSRAADDYGTGSAETRFELWDQLSRNLSQPDQTLVHPVLFVLWFDVFYGSEHRAEAWRMLTADDVNPAQLRTILEASECIPWQWKTDLFERLIDDPSWHEAIYLSLLNSAFGMVGSIDPNDALRVLEKLDLSPHVEGRDDLLRYLIESTA